MPSPIALLLLALSLGCVNADPANTITDNDKAMLRQIRNTFRSLLNSVPNRKFSQFAVLYYGGADVTNVSPNSNLPGCYAQPNAGHVFLTSAVQGYNIGTCPFVAARLIDTRQHTEQTIFASLRTSVGFNCPTPASNMYLYSYNTPCSAGTKYYSGCIPKWVQTFVNTCCNANRRLIIGYSKSYGNEAGSNQLIVALSNAAMTKI